MTSFFSFDPTHPNIRYLMINLILGKVMKYEIFGFFGGGVFSKSCRSFDVPVVVLVLTEWTDNTDTNNMMQTLAACRRTTGRV